MGLARALLREPSADTGPFLFSVLADEPSPRIRRAIVRSVRADSPDSLDAALIRHAESEPDAEVVLAILDRVASMRTGPLVDVLERRLRMPAEPLSPGETDLLQRALETWTVRARGSMVPEFLREAPPVFEVVPAGRPIRAFAWGDFGRGTPGQRRVAEALRLYHGRDPGDFAITVGDNFYPRGMESPADGRWKELWDDLYEPLQLSVFASLGNHDWGHPDSPAAEVLQSRAGGAWQMPATRYSFTAGPAQFFAIDSELASEWQRSWLERELERSTARWKIVYGHHPVFSYGRHGDTPVLVPWLWPLLQEHADLYLAGHDHDLQHLVRDGVWLVVTGAGGAGLRPTGKRPDSLFAASVHGFTVLEADEDSLTVRMVDDEGRVLHEATRTP
ncbi:MAG: metallophosphoesterase [Planctomycetota bacterium]